MTSTDIFETILLFLLLDIIYSNLCIYVKKHKQNTLVFSIHSKLTDLFFIHVTM